MRRTLLALCLPLLAACGSDEGAPAGGAPPGGDGANAIFPADNEWIRDVSGDPVAPDSAAYIAARAASSAVVAASPSMSYE